MEIVSSTGNSLQERDWDVSKPVRDFILWLLIEQEFYRSRSKSKVGRCIPPRRRTQHDGGRGRGSAIVGGGGSEDEDDGVDDNDEDNNGCLILIVDSSWSHELERVRLVEEYANDMLQASGTGLTFKDLKESQRHQLLIQLCRSCDLIFGRLSITSTSDLFRQLCVSKFERDFDVKNDNEGLLGSGAYGQVFHVVSKKADSVQEFEFAIKKISVTINRILNLEDKLNLALNESAILKLLKGHENIVQLYDYWLEIENSDQTDQCSALALPIPNYRNGNGNGNGSSDYSSDGEDFSGPLKFYIQLELCGESLELWKERQKDNMHMSKVILLSRQIFQGLAFIHEKNIMHLDINPKNILWKDSSFKEIKIVDFGLAVRGSTFNERRGTDPYVAPDLPMTPKSDVYSAAVTIIEIAKRVQTKQELFEIIQSRNVSTGENILDTILLKSIDVIAANRPSAKEIVEELRLFSEAGRI